jgi:hypothetical protein
VIECVMELGGHPDGDARVPRRVLGVIQLLEEALELRGAVPLLA